VSNGDAAREETLARLASSRAEIRRLLEPPPREPEGEGSAAGGGDRDAFPRSRTMKLLTSGRGFGTVGALLGGLLIARPALALRMLRLLPLGALGRMLVVKGIAALRARHD
jgi:hypothetical protein